jgi:uncharacterized protein YggE
MNIRTVLALMILAAAPVPALAQDAERHPTTLNLSASGEVEATPDMATLSLGVTSQAPRAAEAARSNAQSMDAVVTTLKRQGLADRDIQTSGLGLGAQYAYPQNQPPKLTGYQASNQVSVVVRDLSKLGPLIDAAAGAGATQINGVSFGLKDPQAAEDEARRQAVKALTAKARLYAQATGYRIVRLVNLSEGGGAPAPFSAPMVMARAKIAATPVEAGELSVRIEVTGVYELAQ